MRPVAIECLGGGLRHVVEEAGQLHNGASRVTVADLLVKVGLQRRAPRGNCDDIVLYPAPVYGEALHLRRRLQAVIEDVPVVLFGLLDAPGLLNLRDEPAQQAQVVHEAQAGRCALLRQRLQELVTQALCGDVRQQMGVPLDHAIRVRIQREAVSGRQPHGPHQPSRIIAKGMVGQSADALSANVVQAAAWVQ